MKRKITNYLDQIYEIPNTPVEKITAIARKGKAVRPYQNILSQEALKKIIDYRTKEGWEIEVRYY